MLADITMCVVFQIFSLVVLYFTNLNHPYNAECKPLHLYYTSHLTLASTFCFLSFHCLLMFFFISYLLLCLYIFFTLCIYIHVIPSVIYNHFIYIVYLVLSVKSGYIS